VRIGETFARYRTVITLVVIIVACIVSLAVSTDSLRLRPKEVGQSVVGVFQQAASAVGGFFSRTVASVRELRDLREEYDGVVEQLREYEETVGDAEALRQENERLREALEFVESIQIASIPARVIAKEPGTFFGGLTINRGRSSGVERNMPVVANQNGVQGLVGRISEVGLTSAVVMPISDVQSFVAARLLRSRYEGLVNGGGAGDAMLSMRYVDKAARSQVSAGDVVITSGMRSIYPPGIYIGTVEAIQGRAYETSLQIQLTPFVDFGRLEYVFVLDSEER
jgi:rod shape-determining protein MreC